RRRPGAALRSRRVCQLLALRRALPEESGQELIGIRLDAFRRGQASAAFHRRGRHLLLEVVVVGAVRRTNVDADVVGGRRLGPRRRRPEDGHALAFALVERLADACQRRIVRGGRLDLRGRGGWGGVLTYSGCRQRYENDRSPGHGETPIAPCFER